MVWGVGLEGVGFRVRVWVRLWGSGLQGLGFGVQGGRFRVWSFGLGGEGLGPKKLGLPHLAT